MSQPGHRRSHFEASLLEATGRAAGAAFVVVSRVRAAKSPHPRGAVYEGGLRINGVRGAPPASLLEEPAERNALVRFSKSIGLPRRVPDLFGISLRLPDTDGPARHQDILTVTSVDILHHLVVSAVLGRFYTVGELSIGRRMTDELKELRSIPGTRAGPRARGVLQCLRE
jgi:hypothetical protein